MGISLIKNLTKYQNLTYYIAMEKVKCETLITCDKNDLLNSIIYIYKHESYSQHILFKTKKYVNNHPTMVNIENIDKNTSETKGQGKKHSAELAKALSGVQS